MLAQNPTSFSRVCGYWVCWEKNPLFLLRLYSFSIQKENVPVNVFKYLWRVQNLHVPLYFRIFLLCWISHSISLARRRTSQTHFEPSNYQMHVHVFYGYHHQKWTLSDFDRDAYVKWMIKCKIRTLGRPCFWSVWKKKNSFNVFSHRQSALDLVFVLQILPIWCRRLWFGVCLFVCSFTTFRDMPTCLIGAIALFLGARFHHIWWKF